MAAISETVKQRHKTILNSLEQLKSCLERGYDLDGKVMTFAYAAGWLTADCKYLKEIFTEVKPVPARACNG